MSKPSRIAFLCLVISGILFTGCSGEVKVGAVISESGSLAAYGDRVRKGLDLAAEELNAGGGVRGDQIQLLYRDDATNEEMGRQVTEELIDQEGVKAIVGAIASPVTLAMAPICEKKGIILISPSSSAPAVTQAGDFVYRNYPSDILEGTAMARFARDLGLERLVIFALEHEFGQGLKDVFISQYESKFRKVVKSFDFHDGDTAGFPAMVEEIKALDPDGIYIISYVNDLSELLRVIDASGIQAVLMGSGAVTPDLVRLAGDTAENFVYPQPNFDVDSREEGVASFVDAYRRKYNTDPDIYAAHGYDALKLLALAMERGGSSHPKDVQLGFASIKDYNGAAGRTTFDENGDVVRYPRMFIIREGSAVPYERFVEDGGSLLAGS